jgi:hypothetical protein
MSSIVAIFFHFLFVSYRWVNEETCFFILDVRTDWREKNCRYLPIRKSSSSLCDFVTFIIWHIVLSFCYRIFIFRSPSSLFISTWLNFPLASSFVLFWLLSFKF